MLALIKMKAVQEIMRWGGYKADQRVVSSGLITAAKPSTAGGNGGSCWTNCRSGAVGASGSTWVNSSVLHNPDLCAYSQ